MRISCARCGKAKEVHPSAFNRAQRIGAPLYCGQKCCGLARRIHKPKRQRVAEKAAYDREYRAKNLATLKAKKAAHHKRTYDPAKAAIVRKARMPYHVEYCRRPEYKRWKSQYDKQFRAKKQYGPFAEIAMLTIELNREIKGRMTNAQIKWENGTSNKAQFRGRDGTEKRERGRKRPRNRRRDHPATDGQRA